MRRIFWVALGATAGVLLVRKLSQTANKLTPASLQQQLASAVSELAASVRDFAAEVRIGMAEREAELRAGLGLDGRHDEVDAPGFTPYGADDVFRPEGG